MILKRKYSPYSLEYHPFDVPYPIDIFCKIVFWLLSINSSAQSSAISDATSVQLTLTFQHIRYEA